MVEGWEFFNVARKNSHLQPRKTSDFGDSCRAASLHRALAEDAMTTIHGAQTLDGFAEQSGCRDGLRVTSLHAGDVIHIQTRRSRYRLLILNEPNHVLIAGGAFFPEPVQATVVGATATGSMLKTGWIGIGLRFEIRVGRHRITTSPVQSITSVETPQAIAVLPSVCEPPDRFDTGPANAVHPDRHAVISSPGLGVRRAVWPRRASPHCRLSGIVVLAGPGSACRA